jgi:DNA-binding beta-propeller fold protein YncE
MFVANVGNNNVSGFYIDPNGSLTPVTGSPFDAGSWPVSIAVDRSAKYVYVANEISNSISAYSIESSGALTSLKGSPFPAGIAPVSVTVTADSGDFYSHSWKLQRQIDNRYELTNPLPAFEQEPRLNLCQVIQV